MKITFLEVEDMKPKTFDELFTYAMKLIASEFNSKIELHCKVGNIKCGISKFIVYPDGRIIKQERGPYGCVRDEQEIQLLKFDSIV